MTLSRVGARCQDARALSAGNIFQEVQGEEYTQYQQGEHDRYNCPYDRIAATGSAHGYKGRLLITGVYTSKGVFYRLSIS